MSTPMYPSLRRSTNGSFPRSHKLAVYILYGAHVQAARRLHSHDQRLIPVQLTRDYRLLLVAAGHAPRARHRPLPGADVELLDELLGVFAHAARVYEASMLELLFLKALQHHVLLEREIQDQPVLVPVLGDVAHALAAHRYAAV